MTGVARGADTWERMKSQNITADSGMSEEKRERRAKRRLTNFDELNSQVEQLSATNRDLEATLRELIEACEAGGTLRYMRALGDARLLLEQLDAAQGESTSASKSG